MVDRMLEVERVMRTSLKQIIEDSLKDYKEVRACGTFLLGCGYLTL